MYDGCLVRPTNNLYSSGTDYYGMIRTKDAIAFASGIDKGWKAFRPETLFSDAIKGLNTFGAKVVRPKELYAIRVKKIKKRSDINGSNSNNSNSINRL